MGPQRLASPLYTCAFPGCPSPVKVSLELVASLQDVVRQTTGDLQGVLYGVRTPGGTEVHSCRPVASFTPEAMDRVSDDKESVGFYRVRHAETMRLTDIEAAIADRSFGKPGSVVLLVQRREGAPQANFFFRENGALVNLSLLMFPLDARLLEERRAEAWAEAPAVAEPPQKRRSWITIAAGVALVAGLADGAWKIAHRAAPADNAETTTTAAVPNTAPLPLRAERQGEDLKVMWDLGSAQIANAISGVLDIDDGGVKRRIPLDARQVRYGSVLYTPSSDEVSIDFTAVKSDGSAGQASVLVLLTRTANGARSPQVRNVAPVAGHAADRRTAPRQFVPPPEKQTATAPREAESLPTAELKTQPVASVHLPEASAPAPPPPPQTATAKPVVSAPQPTATSKPVVSAPPPQRVEPSAPAPVRQAAPAPEPVYYGPQLLSQVGARVPPELRGFVTRPFTVTVRATIDETGRVIHAETPSQKVIHVGFLAAATEAAMRCRFTPARRGNTPVKGEALLTFRFQ